MIRLRFAAILLLLLLATSATSQTKKYQGLLWEITGNGLSEPSYLYGTMHVSNKLAFNVSDAFYSCLGQVDAIGLESSPDSWMQEYRDMGSFAPTDYGYGKNLYKDAFNFRKPGTPEIFTLLENKNSMMNQILYRYVPGDEDYEENTFLDMFIFQAGAKNNKPVYSLENLDEVIKLSIRAMTPDKEKKKENDNNSYLEKDKQMKFVQLEEAYRRGDLDQIDSLSKADPPTKVYHKYFIVERNRNIVNRMDSLMKKHSMFTGIGAAHLPGEEGAIELLRKKGYTVKAVSPKSSGKSHKMRKKFNQQYRAVDFKPWKTQDDFITVSVPGELYEMPTGQRGRMEYFCPEPINGGYFSVIRLFTYGPIFNRGPEFYKATFDSLLYIATPGELLKKEDIELNGHQGYDILTKTSKNSLVNYKVYFTPTEVVIFKGSGNGEYIQKAEPQKFFDNIGIPAANSEWTEVSPVFGGAKWKMKGLVTSQDMIKGLDDTDVDPLYNSYDKETGDYFMVMRYSYNDLDYIEEDSFDLAYLGESFAKNVGYEVEVSSETRNGNKLVIEQLLKVKEKESGIRENLKCKITAKGGTYYMMVAAASEENTRTFFDSFDFTDFKIDNEYKTHVDSSLSFQVETIMPDQEVDYMALAFSLYRDSYKDDENNDYLSDSKTASHYLAKSNEGIYVAYSKFHDYAAADGHDEFWDYQIEQINEAGSLIVSRREMGKAPNGDETMTFLFSDTNSSRGILTKMHLHGGVIYTLQSLIDTVDGPSKYVSTFFDTFEPLDTLIGRDVFEDKPQLFYDHALGSDSLNRVNALKSINEVVFTEEDVDKIVKVYESYDFDEETETMDRENLIMSLGNVEDQKAYDFLIKTFEENSFNSDLQFIILKCFSYTETEEAYDAIRKLLIENTPVTDKSRRLNFFNNVYDSLELADDWFPDMLDVAQSLPEYKPYLIELLAWGYTDSIFHPRHFVSKADMIKREAMIELKRAVADLETDKSDENNYYGRGSLYSSYHSILLDYYALMLGLREAKVGGTEAFFEGLDRMTDEKFIIEQQILNELVGVEVDKEAIAKVVEDIDYRVWTYNRLDEYDMLEYFPDTYSQEEMVKGILYYEDFEEDKDSIVFLSKEYVNNAVDTGYVYFFKRKNEDNQYWVIDYCGVQPTDDKDVNTGYQSTKKGLAYKNEDELQETIDKTMEIFKYEYRLRVEISTGYDWGNLGGLFGY